MQSCLSCIALLLSSMEWICENEMRELDKKENDFAKCRFLHTNTHRYMSSESPVLDSAWRAKVLARWIKFRIFSLFLQTMNNLPSSRQQVYVPKRPNTRTNSAHILQCTTLQSVTMHIHSSRMITQLCIRPTGCVVNWVSAFSILIMSLLSLLSAAPYNCLQSMNLTVSPDFNIRKMYAPLFWATPSSE